MEHNDRKKWRWHCELLRLINKFFLQKLQFGSFQRVIMGLHWARLLLLMTGFTIVDGFNLVMMGGFGNQAKAKIPQKFDGKGTIEKHMRSFMKLKLSDWSNTCDVYARGDKNEKWWFVGKATGGLVCDPTASVAIQKRVILEHSKLLQSELRLAKSLNLWTAPPNTEVEVAQHKQPLTLVGSCKDTELMAKALLRPDVGFEPEQYVNEAKGFYVKLNDDGTPFLTVKNNIVSPDELDKLDLGDTANVVHVSDGDDELKRAAGMSRPQQIIPGKGQM